MKIKLISPSGLMYSKRWGLFPRALRYAPSTLTTLAALIPSHFNAHVEILDEGIDVLNVEDQPDLVAISIITGTSERGYAIADAYRKRDVPVIIGGVHATLMPEEAKHHADAVVTGLAFETWPKLLQDFAEGKLQDFYREPPSMSLSGLPLPRFDLIKPFSYITKTSIQATFGCPFKCDFCAVVATQKNYRHRPIAEVIAQLEKMSKRFVIFVDPSPIEDKRYIKELWRAMIPLKLKWGGLATVRIADDEELMDLAAASGCKGLLIGFETVITEGTKTINKPFNKVSKYHDVVKKLHDRGIGINGTFMFGLDTDGPDCFARTVDFVQEANIDLPRYAIYTPFPGTPVFKRLQDEGRILTTRWSLYDAQHVVFKPKLLTEQQLYEGHIWAWEQTYSIRNMMKRVWHSGAPKIISSLTNVGYHYYANRLHRFPPDTLLSMIDSWNAELSLPEDNSEIFLTKANR